jgi:threonine/homoserine/homoserine lactone efflux protein
MLAHGIAIGVAVAAPVGPVNLLCIRHTLARGMRAGLLTGLGAALADTMVVAFVAGGFIAAELEGVAGGPWLRTAAGLLLMATGLRSVVVRSAPARAAGSAGFAASFVLAASNPLVLVSVGAMFAALGPRTGPLAAGELVAVMVGVALGSTLWWLALTSLVALVRGRCPSGPRPKGGARLRYPRRGGRRCRRRRRVDSLTPFRPTVPLEYCPLATVSRIMEVRP